MKIAALHPPFFFVLPKKNAPCTVEEKGAFSPLYTKADGRFLRRCGGDLPAFCRVQRTLCRPDTAPPQVAGVRWSTGCRTEMPLRFGPGRSASLRPTGVVIVYCPGMRVTRGSRGADLSVFHHDDHRTPATCGGAVSVSAQWTAQPVGDFRTWSAGSEETPGLTFVEQRSHPAFFFSTGRGAFSFDKTKENGGRIPAPGPVQSRSLRCILR